MNGLTGKFLYIRLRTSYNSNVFATCKVLEFNNETVTLVNILSGEIYRLKNFGVLLENFGHKDVFLLPAVELKDNSFMVMSKGDIVFWVRDYYLHRTDGPAMVSGDKKHYYLLGKNLSKEEYLDSLSEEDQTNMLFHLNRM